MKVKYSLIRALYIYEVDLQMYGLVDWLIKKNTKLVGKIKPVRSVK